MTRVKCQHCGKETAKNTTRQQKHLTECHAYKKAMDMDPNRNVPKIQKSLQLYAPTPKQKLDYALSLAIFAGARPFNFLEEDAMREFISLLNPFYNPPNRKTIASTVLDNCYEVLKKQVEARIQDFRYLTVVFDETTTLQHNRIINLSFSVQNQSFYYCSDNMGDATLDAQTIADWVFDKLGIFLESQALTSTSISKLAWEKINAFTTDTCSTMKSVWQRLGAKPELRHSFFIPCDSHGLQLLIKDLLFLPSIRQIFSVATNVVSFFRSSPKQYAILRSHQLKSYGKLHPLIAAVITRWGSQYRMLLSLQRTKGAIIDWAMEASESVKFRGSLLDLTVWKKMEDLLQLLQPLHEAQLMSESDKSTIMMVGKSLLPNGYFFELTNSRYLNGGFLFRHTF